MSAYDEAFHVLTDSRWLRLRRDVRLALWLGRFAWRYVTVGARVRRRYRACRRQGESMFVD